MSRGVGGAGKPARLILAARAAGQGVGLPAGWAVPRESRISRRVRGGGKCPGGSMILPYRGKGNFPIKGGPCGVVDVSLPAASPFMRRVLSPEPVGEGQ